MPGRYIVRGQSAETDAQPYDTAPDLQTSEPAQTFVQEPQTGPAYVQGIEPAPLAPQTVEPYQPYQPYPSPVMPYDPFQGGGIPQDPYLIQGIPAGLDYYDPYSRDFKFGLNGPEPFRLPGAFNFDSGWLMPENAKGVPGSFEVFEANLSQRNSALLMSGTIFSFRPEYNFRSWQGPDNPFLPGAVHRIATDFEWAGQGPGPWGFQLGFTPQIVSDFDRPLTSEGYSWDARAMLFFKPMPRLTLVGGAAYWDRVTDRFVPHAGLVWTPDDRWEFRLLFPQSRISVLLGNFGYGGVWLYGSAEYHSEAYQVSIRPLQERDRVELTDYRFLVGLRNDNGFTSSFIEGGWIMDRQVNFMKKSADFDIADGWMIRAGIRF